MASTATESDPLAWLPWLLQTADALFPTGAYAHSVGFEQSVQLGASDLALYLRERTLPALREFELPYLRFCYEAAQAEDRVLLGELNSEIGAAKLAREIREASRQLGGRRVAALRVVFPNEPLLDALPDAHHLAVCALQAAVIGAPLGAALAAYYYQTIAAIGAAALKLIRVGQEGVQRALTEANRQAGAIVAASLLVPRESAGWFDPLLEIAAMRHERAEERLFIS